MTDAVGNEVLRGRLRFVREGINSGAGTADEQLAYLLHIFQPLPSIKTEADLLVDELALALEDALIGARSLVAEGVAFPGVVIERLAAASDLLEPWGGPDHGDFWYASGLRSHPVWEQVRGLSRDALRAFDSAFGGLSDTR